MRKGTRYVLGFDISDRWSTLTLLDTETGEEMDMTSVATTPKGVTKAFQDLPRDTHVVIETGTHAGWIATLGRRLGLQVTVADARRLEAVTKHTRKSDRHDAQILAHLGASSMDLICSVYVRDGAVQADLATLRLRDDLVAARTMLVNACRGCVKSLGQRLPSASTESFAKKVKHGLSPELEPVVGEAVKVIAAITAGIKAYDAQAEALCAKYPETQRLRAVDGVGRLGALCFVLTICDPARFEDVRDVAAYIGLVPRLSQSGDIDRQTRISKAGNAFLRRLLVQDAHHILGPFGKECDLRTWGLKLAARGGKAGKKRAVIAVTRKLAVLLLVLWRDGAAYEPVRKTQAVA